MVNWLTKCFESSQGYEIPRNCLKRLFLIGLILSALVKFYVVIRDYLFHFNCLFPNDLIFFSLLGISYLLYRKDKFSLAVKVLIFNVWLTLTYCLLAGHYSSLFWFPIVPLIAGIFFSFREFLFFSAVPLVTNTVITIYKLRNINLHPNSPLSPLVISTEAFFAYLTFLVSVAIYKLFLEGYQRKLKLMLEFDVLTEALTRRALFYNLHTRKSFKKNYSVLMIDIDHFKRVNDDFGHQTGDKVLRELGKLIRKNLRQEDLFGRYGGEEFLVVIPNSTKDKAKLVAEKLRRIIENHDFGILRRITVSIGVADSTEGEKIEKVIKLADERLYKAKRLGRNRVVSV